MKKPLDTIEKCSSLVLHFNETLIAEKLSLQRALGYRNTNLGVISALPLAGCITLTKS